AIRATRLRTLNGLALWTWRAGRLARTYTPGFTWCAELKPAGYPARRLAWRAGIPYGVVLHGTEVLALDAKSRRRRFQPWTGGARRAGAGPGRPLRRGRHWPAAARAGAAGAGDGRRRRGAVPGVGAPQRPARTLQRGDAVRRRVAPLRAARRRVRDLPRRSVGIGARGRGRRLGRRRGRGARRGDGAAGGSGGSRGGGGRDRATAGRRRAAGAARGGGTT